jgi:peptidoglycan/xylan/chitin deacetylase (PgdA/CDA1 family)
MGGFFVKQWKRHGMLFLSVLLSVVLLSSTIGCSFFPTDITVNEENAEQTSENSSRVNGSAAEPEDEQDEVIGSAVLTGGLEEEIPEAADEPETDIPAGEKYIAITFDDGPTGNEGGRTERLLNGLKERGAHATFFLCGYRVTDFHSMMDRYLTEGHEVGNHTMDHKILTTQTSDGGYNQAAANNDLIESYLGEKPTLMRPPGGYYDKSVRQVMKKLGLPIILWNVDTLDWQDRDADMVKQRILDGAEDGAIVLEHDLYETTVEGVLAAIDELQEQGYAFVTVSELAQIKGVELQPGHVYTDFTDATLNQDSDSDA